MDTSRNTSKKRLLSMLLMACMVVTLLPAMRMTASAADPTPISSVAITGVTAPVAGQTATKSEITTTTEGVKIDTTYTNWYVKSDDNHWIECDGTTFETGKVYRLRVYVYPSPSSSYKFATSITATVNGMPATSIDVTGVAVDRERDRMIYYEYERLGGETPVTTIDSVTITGVREPVNNELPTYAGITVSTAGVKMDSRDTFWLYDENGAWYTMSGRFYNGGTYGIKFILDVEDDSRYVFSDSLTVTVNGRPAEVKGTGVAGDDRKIVICSFGKLGSTAIDISSVSINNVQDPVEDECATTDGIGVSFGPANAGTVVDKFWMDADDGEQLEETDTFVYGHEYYLVTIIDPRSGYSFAYNSYGKYTGRATVNGEDAALTGKSNSSDRLYVYSKNIRAKSSISKVVITDVPTPVAGQSCNTDGIRIASVPVNTMERYDFEWVDDLGNAMPSTAKFEEGKKYYLRADVFSEEDYSFRYDASENYLGTATINGESAASATKSGSRQLCICSKSMVAEAAPRAEVRYMTHIQLNGWEKTWKKDGEMSGTSGESKRLEAIKIDLGDTNVEGSVEYRTHIQNLGWETTWKKDGEMSGTSGKAYRLEAIQIRLTGQMAEKYDVYYRVHAQNFGWLDWAKNGDYAGTAGFAYRLEGIEIKLVKKGDPAPGSTKTPYRYPMLSYTTHVQDFGWQPNVMDGVTSGTVGKSKRLEAIKIQLKNQAYAGNIEYKTHIQNIGWETSWKKNGAMSGTSGKAYRLEAIQIRLTGEMAAKYDIYYRVHAQNFGWMGWAKNGASAGTAGFAYRLEGIQIVIVPKGDPAPGSTANCFRQK